MTGGFPNVATFPTDGAGGDRRALIADDRASRCSTGRAQGLPSVREYLPSASGRRRAWRPREDELMVTSGGMECIDLLCRALLDPGDDVAIEAPTYLGAIMGFAGYRRAADRRSRWTPRACTSRARGAFAGGYRPKFVYVIPEFQNPSGRTLSLERRRGAGRRVPRYGVLIFEDVAYRELSFDGAPLPSLWSLGPDVVLQAGTFSKVFSPGFAARLGARARRARRAARRRQAEHRPVRGRARPADGRGVRPRGALRRRLPRARGAVRVALGRAVGLAFAPTCPRASPGASRPAACSPGCGAGGPRRARAAPGRDRGGVAYVRAARSTWATTATTRCGCPSATSTKPSSSAGRRLAGVLAAPRPAARDRLDGGVRTVALHRRAGPPARSRRDRHAGAGHQAEDAGDVAARLGVGRHAAARRDRRPGRRCRPPARAAPSRTAAAGRASGAPGRRSPARGRTGRRGPSPRAVAGMNCAMPCAPASETANGLKLDSA